MVRWRPSFEGRAAHGEVADRRSRLGASRLAAQNDGWPTNHARPPQDDGRPRTTRDRRFRTARPSRRRPLLAGTVTDFVHWRKGSRNFARRNRAHPGAEQAPSDVTRITRPYRQAAFIRGPAGASAVCTIFQPGLAVSIERGSALPTPDRRSSKSAWSARILFVVLPQS